MDDLIEFAVELGLELLEPLWLILEKLFCRLTGRKGTPRTARRARPRALSDEEKRLLRERGGEEAKRFWVRFALCMLGLLLAALIALLLTMK